MKYYRNECFVRCVQVPDRFLEGFSALVSVVDEGGGGGGAGTELIPLVCS